MITQLTTVVHIFVVECKFQAYKFFAEKKLRKFLLSYIIEGCKLTIETFSQQAMLNASLLLNTFYQHSYEYTL
jgi:hypothetical protein